MGTPHIAARWEDAVNRRLVPYLKERGWRPRAISYVGYGSPRWIRVLGRVVLGRYADGEYAVDQAKNPFELAEAVFFKRGWRSFINTPVSYLPVEIEVYGKRYRTTTDRAGYLDLVISDPATPLDPGWHVVTIHANAAPSVQARIQVISDDARIGIISDIDDTAMVTSVPRAFIAMWNTFVRQGSSRKVVPGMAELFHDIRRRQPETPTFFISTGAWSITPTLIQVLRTAQFPAGTMLMTDWGPTNTGWFRSGQEHKRHSLRRLRTEFPQLQWVLVGDDGQHDPMIYREFAREFPDAVAAIAIRQLTPTEQVLSHGTTKATSDTRWTPAGPETLEVHGGDGHRLRHELRGFLQSLPR